MKKKILVVYAQYGSGHKSIAEYVASYIKNHNKDYEVKTIDMTLYGGRLAKLSSKVMDYVLKRHHEFLFNFCYELMDHRLSTIGNNTFAKKCFDNKNLRKAIREFNPDITISSHFYCSNIITYYNKEKIINSKLITILTDYRAHEFWIRNHELEDGFIVGNNIVKEELVKKGVEAKKVHAFGLPLNISVINNLDSEDVIYKRYNLKKNQKVFLFFGGSSAGSMYYYNYFKAICTLNLKGSIIFISGKNIDLEERCREFVKKNNISNVKVLGYTKDVLNLMKISDLVISKPGGATVTECLEMKVPMVLVPGIGGQERYNAKFITKKKYGIKVRGIWSFKRNIRKLDQNPNLISKMRERLNRLDNNKSVEKIYNLISKM